MVTALKVLYSLESVFKRESNTRFHHLGGRGRCPLETPRYFIRESRVAPGGARVRRGRILCALLKVRAIWLVWRSLGVRYRAIASYLPRVFAFFSLAFPRFSLHSILSQLWRRE